MATLEETKRMIASAQDLYSVVKTMKALAAVNIRQHQAAVASLAQYYKVIEFGLQALLSHAKAAEQKISSLTMLVVIGSHRGLAGQFNVKLSDYLSSQISEMKLDKGRLSTIVIGERIKGDLAGFGLASDQQFFFPSSLEKIDELVFKILIEIENRGAGRVVVFNNKPLSGSSYRPVHRFLLPLDQSWLSRLKKRKWPTNKLPLINQQRERLKKDLIRQYLIILLSRSLVNSLASENAARLAAMQVAEKNINERLVRLQGEYNHQRQSAITSELLDIAAGYQALKA